MAFHADSTAPGDAQSKAKIFISYSRKDSAFVDKVDAALRSRGFEPLVDRSEIYAFEDWWSRIQTLITKADTIVFVLSPDAVASDICAKEVEFAASLNKRFAPIVARPVDDKMVPLELRRLNFIFCNDEARFDVGMTHLAEALTTDIEWVRKHTDIGEQARRWAEAGRPGPRGLLLRSPLLEAAEQWISARPENGPTPTEDMQLFIVESRRASTQRRNILTASLGAGFVIALALAGLAYWQRGIAVEQQSIADHQRGIAIEQREAAEQSERRAGQERDRALLTQSRFLADLGIQKLREGEAGVAALLALEALPDTKANVLRPYSPEAEYVLAASRKVLRDFRIFTGHSDVVTSGSFSPDGKQVLTSSSDGTARVWDIESGKEIYILREKQRKIRNARFSPDGQFLLTESTADGSSLIILRLWKAETGKEIFVIETHSVFGGFSPDSRRILTIGSQGAILFDTDTGKEAITLTPEFGSSIATATFGHDGRHIFTIGHNGAANLWDTNTGKIIVKYDIDARVGTAVFSPDGERILVRTYENSLVILEIFKSRPRTLLARSKEQIYFARFSPDGTKILIAQSKIARLWDVKNGDELNVFNGHDEAVIDALFSPNGQLILTKSYDKTARLWDAATGKTITVLHGYAEEYLGDSIFSPDGRYILTGTNSDVRLWLVHVPNDVLTMQGHSDGITTAVFSLDGRWILTASRDRTARIWDATSAKELIVLSGHHDEILFAEFSPNGEYVVTASRDSTARLWERGSGKLIRTLHHNDNVSMARFSSDGRFVLTASHDGKARLWDVATGKVTLSLDHDGMVFIATFSPNGRLIATNSIKLQSHIPDSPGKHDRDALIWDIETGRQLAVLRGHEEILYKIEFSPDGQRLVTASHDGTARIWQVVSGQQLSVLRGHSKSIWTASFSPDGARIVTGAYDGTARIWDSNTGNLLNVLRGHGDLERPPEIYVDPAVFDGSGNRVLTASNDKTVRIWDAASGKERQTFRDHTGAVRSAVFSRDGRYVLSASDDNTARLRPTWNTQELVDFIKNAVPRCLTRTQRENAYLDRTPPAWCIEMTKWPYHTQEWKDWLDYTRTNLNPPLPDTEEWQPWIAAHKSTSSTTKPDTK